MAVALGGPIVGCAIVCIGIMKLHTRFSAMDQALSRMGDDTVLRREADVVNFEDADMVINHLMYGT